MASDELVLIDHPPGPAWSGLAEALWRDEVPFLPIDHRITDRERRAIVDRARPQFVPGHERRDAAGRRGAGHARRGRRVLARRGGRRPQARRAPPGRRGRLPDPFGRSAWAPPPGLRGCAPAAVAHRGCSCCCARRPRLARRRARAVRAERVVTTEEAPRSSVVPSMVRRLVEADLGLHGLTLLVGGGPIDPATAGAARSRGARLVTTYGLTETCGGSPTTASRSTGCACASIPRAGSRSRARR